MMMAKSSKVLLHRGVDQVWVQRTEPEFQALHDKDAAAGRWCDDGGEPIIYGPYSGWNHDQPAQFHVTVTAMRPKWLGWGRRPKGLRAGWCEELNREILFKSV
jgi:hypothetical protein